MLRKLEAIEKKILELKEEIRKGEIEIEERKYSFGESLGKLALVESAANRTSAERCENLHMRIKKRIDENKMALSALEIEKRNVANENAEKDIAEIPSQLETMAVDFNLLLDEGINLLGGVEILHEKLIAKQTDFHALAKKRADALMRMNRREGLILETGLGRLSQVGLPYGQAFSVPDKMRIGNFVAELRQYKNSLKNYEVFKKSNPKYQEDVSKTNLREAEQKIPFQFWNVKSWQL